MKTHPLAYLLIALVFCKLAAVTAVAGWSWWAVTAPAWPIALAFVVRSVLDHRENFLVKQALKITLVHAMAERDRTKYLQYMQAYATLRRTAGWSTYAGVAMDLQTSWRRLKAGVELEQRQSLLLEQAWGVIANVSGGDWELQAEPWREAAKNFREDYHRLQPDHITSNAQTDAKGSA